MPQKRIQLTPKQQRVFDALNTYIDLHDRVPTHAQLADVLGVGRTTVTVHLASIEEKGYIRRTRRWCDLSLLDEQEYQSTHWDDVPVAEEVSNA